MGDVINLSASVNVNVPEGTHGVIQTCSRLCNDLASLLKKSALLALILAASPFVFYGFWKIMILFFGHMRAFTCAWIFGFIVAFCYSVYLEEYGGGNGSAEWWDLGLGLGGYPEHIANTLSNAAGIFGATNNVIGDGANFFTGMLGGGTSNSNAAIGGQGSQARGGYGAPSQPSSVAAGGGASAHLNPPVPGAIPFECGPPTSASQRRSVPRSVSDDPSRNQVQGGGPSRVTVGSLVNDPSLDGGHIRTQVGETFNRDASTTNIGSASVQPSRMQSAGPPAAAESLMSSSEQEILRQSIEPSSASQPSTMNTNSQAQLARVPSVQSRKLSAQRQGSTRVTVGSLTNEPSVGGGQVLTHAGSTFNRDLSTATLAGVPFPSKRLSAGADPPLVGPSTMRQLSKTSQASRRQTSGVPAASAVTMLTGKQFSTRDVTGVPSGQASLRRQSQMGQLRKSDPNMKLKRISLPPRCPPGELLSTLAGDPRTGGARLSRGAGQIFNRDPKGSIQKL